MKKILIPRSSSFFPNNETRKTNREIVLNNPPEKFNSYEDWFYFVHIDPVQRWIHLVGMWIGLYFFIMIFIEWSLLSFLYYLLGVFFFFGLGIISHKIYDFGEGTSAPKKYHSTLLYVVRINLRTMFFVFDPWLRSFQQKYPQQVADFNLEELTILESFKKIFFKHP